jgi:hypothetical protein
MYSALTAVSGLGQATLIFSLVVVIVLFVTWLVARASGQQPPKEPLAEYAAAEVGPKVVEEVRVEEPKTD